MRRCEAVSQGLVLKLGRATDLDVGHLSKQDMCKHPTKIVVHGRMEGRIALSPDFLAHLIITIMSNLRGLFPRAKLATLANHNSRRATLNELVVLAMVQILDRGSSEPV